MFVVLVGVVLTGRGVVCRFGGGGAIGSKYEGIEGCFGEETVSVMPEYEIYLVVCLDVVGRCC